MWKTTETFCWRVGYRKHLFTSSTYVIHARMVDIVPVASWIDSDERRELSVTQKRRPEHMEIPHVTYCTGVGGHAKALRTRMRRMNMTVEVTKVIPRAPSWLEVRSEHDMFSLECDCFFSRVTVKRNDVAQETTAASVQVSHCEKFIASLVYETPLHETPLVPISFHCKSLDLQTL